MTPDPDLHVNGVRPGMTCWLVPAYADAELPVRIDAAVVVRCPLPAVLDAQSRPRGPNEVFATERAARQAAYHRAAYDSDYHRSRLAAAEAVLLALSDEASVVNSLGDAP